MEKTSRGPDPRAESVPVEAPRRLSLWPTFNELSRPGALRPPSKAPPPAAPPMVRRSMLIVAAIALAIALVAGGLYAKHSLHERSPAGRVHRQLLARGFAPAADMAARDAAFAELDRMGAVALPIVIDKLADSSPAQDATSRSSRTIQMLAHDYLMYVATRVQTPPPAAASEAASALSAGNVSQAQWLTARDAWRVWVTEQQANGLLPR